jgi:hypothetical protein
MGDKITAVDWLVENIHYLHSTKWNDIIEQAKLMEKEQIIHSHLDGQSLVSCKDEYAEQYYNETYKQEE